MSSAQLAGTADRGQWGPVEVGLVDGSIVTV